AKVAVLVRHHPRVMEQTFELRVLPPAGDVTLDLDWRESGYHLSASSASSGRAVVVLEGNRRRPFSVMEPCSRAALIAIRAADSGEVARTCIDRLAVIFRDPAARYPTDTS